jgi:WXXGXW repeat (2 copies)
MAQISVSIVLAPPPLPVYEQPALAEEGAIWVPGYWDYGSGGYFWVPGTWVQPPAYGLLWTPGYWGWGNGTYAWSEGYWGSSVGFYGGVNYGFGYSGHGYTGGRWRGQHFYYNTAVNHVNVTDIHNTYTETTVNNTTVNRVSFNGGKGGLTARPTSAEQAAARAPHQPATALQDKHRQAAMANHPVHAADLPPVTHLAAQSTGNVARNNETLRQQNTLRDGQEKQRQELQRSQTADHERAAKQPSANNNDQELEQRHQAQTQELMQRHATEQKTLQESQGRKPEESRDQSHSK